MESRWHGLLVLKGALRFIHQYSLTWSLVKSRRGPSPGRAGSWGASAPSHRGRVVSSASRSPGWKCSLQVWAGSVLLRPHSQARRRHLLPVLTWSSLYICVKIYPVFPLLTILLNYLGKMPSFYMKRNSDYCGDK